MISPQLLSMLCCPETREALSLADEETLRSLNEKIAEGKIKNVSGAILTEPIEELLLASGGKRAYQVKSGIPILLADEAISLEEV